MNDALHTPDTNAPASPASPGGGSRNQRLGSLGERIAERQLVATGLSTLERNWRCRYGELDLIMKDGDTFVAVEVKTRSGTGYGSPLEAITPRKAARLRRLLLEWSTVTGNRARPLRVDAVGVTFGSPGGAPRITHLRAVA